MGPGRSREAGSEIRTAFVVTATLLTVMLTVYGLYTLNLEQYGRQQRLERLASFVAATSHLYFDHYRTGLHFLAADLGRVHPFRQPRDAANVLARFGAAYPALKAIAVLGARGPAWLSFSRGLRTSTIPWRHMMDARCRGFGIGMPERIRPGGRRYIPVCTAVGGEHPFTILALLTPRNQRRVWGQLIMPAGLSIDLLRKGDYLENSWPLVPVHYRQPLSGLRSPILGRSDAGHGDYAGLLHVGHQYRLGAFDPVKGYPLVAYASIPETTVVWAWWRLVRASLLVLLAVLGAAYGIYRWALSRQRAWEKERHEGESKLFAAKERIEVTLRSILDAVVAADTKGYIQYLNPTAERMTGWTLEEVAGRPLNEVFPCLDEKNGDLLDPIPVCLRRQAIGPEDGLLLHRDGRALAVERTAAPMRAHDGSITGIVMVFHDVSEKRMLAARLAHQASHDPLTGLPNRALFNARLHAVIGEADARSRPLALLLIDLDGFKRVNDTLGHGAGDTALANIGRKLADVLRSTDLLARLGGDEFGVILPNVKEPDEVARIVRKLADAFAEPALTEPEEIFLGGSIGIALYPADAQDAEGLVRAADIAMYEAKAAGKNTHRFFRAAMSEHSTYLLSLEGHLRRALEHGEFDLLFEPQVSLQAGTVAGFEVLLQWHHPTEGVMPSSQFITVAEDCGLILPLGASMLRMACDVKRAWRDRGVGRVPMALNMTARQCLHEETPALVRQALENSELAPADLVIEVAERALARRPAETLAVLRAMRDIGVGLTVDDFGADLPSLGFLRQLPIDALKIDRSFVQGIPGDEDNEAIVRAIIALGHSLRLLVIGAGVDSAAQYEFLRAAGCDIAQGRYVSDPLGVPEAEAYLRRA